MKILLRFFALLFSFHPIHAQSSAEKKTPAESSKWNNQEHEAILLTFNQPYYAPGDSVLFSITFKNVFRTKSEEKEILHMDFIDSTSQSKLHSNFCLIDGKGSFSLYIPKNFPVGVYNVRISPVNDWDITIRILGMDELIFVKEKRVKKLVTYREDSALKIKSPKTIHLKIKPEKDIFSCREKALITLDLVAPDESPIRGIFAVTIVENKSFSTSSHIKPESSKQQIDLYNTLNKKREGMKYDKSIITLTGRAFKRDDHLPLPDSTLLMIYLKRNLIGYETYIQSDGRFNIPLYYDFYGEDQIFYYVENNGKPVDNGKIEIEQKESFAHPAPKMIEIDSLELYSEFILKKNSINGSYSFFNSSIKLSPQKPIDPNKNFEDEIGGADVFVNTQDYASFATVQELIRVVPALYYRKVGNKHMIQQQLSNAVVPKVSPTFIIDGNITRDINSFIELNPSDIVYIKVVKDINKLSRFGSLGKFGLVLVRTKGQKTPHLDDNTIKILGLVENYKSNIIVPEPHVPFLLSNPFWSSHLEINSNHKATFSFTAPDNIGKFTIYAYGITSSNEVVYSSSELEIVFAPKQ